MSAHTHKHTDLHAGSVVCPYLTPQACNEALEKVCSKAAAVVQINLRSHSDNRLAFSSFPKPLCSVTGWDGLGDLIQLSVGRRFWLGLLQMWWVWDTKLGRHFFETARGQRAAFLLLCPSFPGKWMRSLPLTRNCEKITEIKQTMFSKSDWKWEKVALESWTFADSSHFWNSVLDKYIDSFCHCGCFHLHTTPTTMTRGASTTQSIYLLRIYIYPWALTAHCLCHCGSAGAPLPVCLPISCLSERARTAHWWQSYEMLDHCPKAF